MSALISHLIGTALAATAFLVFGRGIVRKGRGKDFNPLPAFILLVIGVVYQVFLPASGATGCFAHLFLDFGLGMTIASLYLSAHRAHPRLFWVPGLLGVMLGGVLYGFSFLLHQGSTCNKPDSIQLLVELGPDDNIDEIDRILRKYGAEAQQAFPNVDLSEDEDLAQYYLVYVDSTLRTPLELELRNDRENVDGVELNHSIGLFPPIPAAEAVKLPPGEYIADDPYLGQQWYARSLEYNAVYQLLQAHKPRKKVKVAIVDTGVDSDHEDLSGIYTRSGGQGDKDQHSHGTHCGGLAGAHTNNGRGVGSLNWNGEFITLSGFPALDAQGRGTDQRVAKAIIDAAEAGADVISMSLGGFSPMGAPKSQRDAIKYARKLGAIVVVAAGNSNDDARKYSPANITGVITVSAVDEQLGKASFSNYNNHLKMPIAAPGVSILSAVPGSKYMAYNGTSMATPIVSGLVGILRAYRPDLSAEEAYGILEATGTEVPDSDKVGKVINPRAAIEAVLQLP
ncbi:MAG: S8 family peptidase [Bacteroidia bacterium]